MVLTLLVGAGFVAVGIAVMAVTARAAFAPVLKSRSKFELPADRPATHRAA